MTARRSDRAPPRVSPETWRAVLAGRPPAEVLEALLEGDPLGLRARVARALERRVLALDAERAHLRAAARIARLAGGYRGHPAPDRWLDERVDEALSALVREDLEDERDGTARAPLTAGVAGALGFDAGATRRVLSAFNRFPLADRRAFFELVVRGGDFDELGRGAVAAARRARAVWIALLCAEHGIPSSAPATSAVAPADAGRGSDAGGAARADRRRGRPAPGRGTLPGAVPDVPEGDPGAGGAAGAPTLLQERPRRAGPAPLSRRGRRAPGPRGARSACGDAAP